MIGSFHLKFVCRYYWVYVLEDGFGINWLLVGNLRDIGIGKDLSLLWGWLNILLMIYFWNIYNIWWGMIIKGSSWSIHRIFSLDVAGSIEEINFLTPLTFINPPTPISINPQLIFTHHPIFLLIVLLPQHRKIFLKLWLPLFILHLFMFNWRSIYYHVCTWKLCLYGFCNFKRKSSQPDELALFFHCRTNNPENFISAFS